MTRYLRATARLFFFVALLAALLFVSAPYLLTSRLLPAILTANGLTDVTIRILQLSPWQAQGSLVLSAGQARPAVTGMFRIEYSPWDLLQGQIAALSLQETTIRLTSHDGKVAFSGFPLDADTSNAPARTSALPPLPFMIAAFSVTNCQLLVEQPGRPTLPLLLTAELHPDFEQDTAGNFNLKALQTELSTDGLLTTAMALGLTRTDDNGVRLTVDGRIPKFQEIRHFLPLPASAQFRGQVDIAAELELDRSLQNLLSLNATLHLPEFVLSSPTLTIGSPPEAPVELTVKGTGENLDFRINHLAIAEPFQAAATVSGKVQPALGRLTANGSITATALQEPIVIEIESILAGTESELRLLLSGERQLLQLPDLAMESGPYRLETQLALAAEDRTEVKATVQLSSLRFPMQKLQLAEINAELRYRLGDRDGLQPESGKLSIARIIHANETVASLAATLEQITDGISFGGEVKSQRSRALRLQFSGSSTLAVPLQLAFTLPATTISHRTLPAAFALPKGLTFSGRMTGKGTLGYSGGNLHGEASVSLTDATLDLPEQKIHLDGVGLSLNLPSLPQIRSGASQQLQVANMGIGNLKFTDGRIVFRLDDATTLFIEKSRFTWCSGKVESGSLRLSLADPTLATTLYCDRLQFTELLGQLGISNAEGDGSLNGRLPFSFDGKTMVFDDGFLFSTPGNSGIVRFNNTAMLRQGLPETGQPAYLEYSMQAMENFSYNWTKLTFSSKGDDLLIAMQIDGKPATPLPFGYKGGQLVSAPDGQGIQHPIRLDVNFHLPFAQIFKYGQNIQKIMQ